MVILILLLLLQLVYCIDIITTIAGTGTSSFSGDGSQATAATLSGPFRAAVDLSGMNIVIDYFAILFIVIFSIQVMCISLILQIIASVR